MDKNKIFSFTSILILFIIWQFYSISISNDVLMPYPKDVFVKLFELMFNVETLKIIYLSVLRMLTALSMAFILGSILGLLSGVSEKTMYFLRPIVVSARTLPVISIIIVLLIIFGNTITLYIVMLLLLFPIIYQSVLDGVKNIDPLLLDAMKLESDHKNFDSFRLVYFPLSLPYLRTALIDSIGLGFKILVVAEYIAQTQNSIGRTIYMHKINLEFVDVFAWTILLLLFVLMIEFLLEKVLKGEK